MPINYFPNNDSSSQWGNIAGNILEQTDLHNELLSKADAVHTHLPNEVGIASAINEPNAINKDYFFNGSSSKAHISGGSELSFNDGVSDKPFTILAFFSIDEAGSYQPLISKYENNPEYTLLVSPQGRIIFRLYSSAYANYLEISSDENVIIPNNVYYISAVYDGTQSATSLSLYINGELQSAEVSQFNYTGMAASESDLIIGNFNSYYLKGNISNICIISDYLNANEISRFTYKGKFCTDIIYKEYFDKLKLLLDDTSTFRNLWLDKSGNLHNAIPHNTDYNAKFKLNEILYHSDIDANTELNNFIPSGYFIDDILIKTNSGGEIGKKVNIGITFTGAEIVSAIELSQNVRYRADISDIFFDSDTTIYINDSSTITAWDAGTPLTFDLTIYLKLAI